MVRKTLKVWSLVQTSWPHEDTIHGKLSGRICSKQPNHPRLEKPLHWQCAQHEGKQGNILEGPDNVILKQALKLNFKPLNNQAEYEALIVGLKLAREVGAKKLRCYTYS